MHACMRTHCTYACILSTATVVWRLPRGHHVTEAGPEYSHARGEPTTLKGEAPRSPGRRAEVQRCRGAEVQRCRGAEVAEGSRAALGWLRMSRVCVPLLTCCRAILASPCDVGLSESSVACVHGRTALGERCRAAVQGDGAGR